MRLPLAGLVAAGLFHANAFALTPSLHDVEALPLVLVRAPLAKQIELAQTKSRPYQYAVKAPLSATLHDGAWDYADGLGRWRLRIGSPGAQSLAFEFDRFELAPGAALWVYDAQGALVQGPYTSADVSSEGKVWTALVLGEQAVLELRVPEAARAAAALELAFVAHGFRGFGKDDGAATPKSGSCNIDVVCPAANAWRNEIRSVARITIDNAFLCTGQLMNNTRQNSDPLFLTANHCGIGQAECGLTGNSVCAASSVVFYWNYFNANCRSATGTADRNGNGSLAQNQRGASLLAGDVGTDFTLLRLNNAPSASYGLYMAGWNATGDVPQSGVSIHHPAGDEKSIAFFGNPAERAETCIQGSITACTRNVRTWGVRWNQGTTEQGSSGGGLWDQNHQVVGWLSGGDASCSNTSGEDFFGRMESAWTAGAQSNQQLKTWLAPDGSGAMSLCGKNQSGGACDNSAAPTGGGGDSGGGALPLLALLPLVFVTLFRSRKRTSTLPGEL